jgi:tape measure domain-containing protein
MAIRVELELIDGTFTTRMLHAGETVDRFNAALARTHPQAAAMARQGDILFRSVSRVDGGAKGLLATLRDFTVVAGAAAYAIAKLQQITISYVGSIVQVNSEFERMTQLFAGMSTAADPMADAKNQLLAFRQAAKEMPFALETITAGAVKLRSVGMEPVAKSVRAVGDAVAAFGGTDESFTRTILAMTQMSGKGVIQMEELRQQLGEAVPRATELMARSMGVSYAQLMDLIATGTVESNHALRSMQLEFERTFGGASVRLMNTYAGQMKLLTTNLQNLALNVGGDENSLDSFFGQLKKQLQDLNFFLEGPQAREFAEALGRGLQSAVVYLRQGIELLVQYGDELKNIAIIVGSAFGLQLAIRAVASLGAMVAGLGGAWGRVQMAVAAYNTQLIAAQTASRAAIGSGFLASLGNIAAMFGNMRFNIASLRVALGLLAGALGGLAGALPLVGLAIWGLAEYFDWFGMSADEALKKLEELEGKSRSLEVQQDLQDVIAAAEARVNVAKALAATAEQQFGFVPQDNIEELADAQNQLAQLQARVSAQVTKAGEEDLRRAAAEARNRISIFTDEINRRFDLKKKEISDFYDAELASGKSVTQVNKDRVAALTEQNDLYYKEQIDMLQQYIDLENDMLAGRDGIRLDVVGKEMARARLGAYVAAQNQLRESQREFANLGMSVKLVDAGDDPAKMAARAETALNNLKETASGLKSQLQGGSNAMGELVARIENGDFGNLNDEGVKKYVEQLIRAQEEVDNLTEAVEYMTDSQKLYDKTLSSIEDKTFDLMTANMNPLQKYAAEQARLAQSVSPGGRMALMMLDLKDKVDATNTSLGSLIRGFVEQLFGTGTTTQGQTVVGILDQMLQRVRGITGAISGLQFNASGSAMGMSFNGTMMSGPSIEEAVKNGILSLIGAAEGTDKGRGYNETLGYGAFTGGPVDLVNMTLQEILELQRQMLANPANPFNSSAVGRYQITRETLLDFMRQMNLSPDMKFTPELQDAIAKAIIQSTGGDVGRMRGRWEGLERVDDATITTALGNGTAGFGGLPNMIRDGTNQVLSVVQQFQTLSEALTRQGDAAVGSALNAYSDELAEIALKAKGATDAEIALRQRIREGQLDPMDRDPASERYRGLFEILKQVTSAELEYQTAQEKRSEVEKALKQNAEDLLEAERELKTEQTRDTNPYAEQQAGLEALKLKYDELIAKAREVYGVESQEYRTLLAQKEQALTLQQQRDFTSTMSILDQKKQAALEANMTEVERTRSGIDQQIAEIQRYVQNFRGTEAERVQVVASAEATIAALRQQGLQASNNAFTQQMRQWSDLSGNMAQYMAGVANTVADGITQMIMGEKVDWQKMLKSTLSDLVNMGVKYLMSSLMGGKGMMLGGMGGMGGKGKGMMAAGLYHTGGIVGRMSSAKMVSPMAFAGAPRFHSGGMIRDMGLAPDEVPIIARKGEGVFTPDQMRAMSEGGKGNAVVNTNVTVNANGGDSKQNADLAKQVARQVEESVRGIVFKEIQAQRRPGNMMGR